jgi:hypothetical protein
MQCQYRVLEVREIKRIIFISMIIAISLGFIAVLFELRLFNLIAFLGPAFIIIQKFSTIYLIDTDKMTLSVNLGKKEWRRVNLGDISKMEIHRKKNGKIKKINLRNSSNLFFTYEPARGDEFAAQIKKLIPEINTEEHKARWHS